MKINLRIVIRSEIRNIVISKEQQLKELRLGSGQKERKKWFDYVSKDIRSGSDLFLTKVSKEFSLKQIIEAITYYNKNMSEGKVILKPKF